MRTTFIACAGIAVVLATALLACCAGAELSNVREAGDGALAITLLLIVERQISPPLVGNRPLTSSGSVASAGPVRSEVLVDDLSEDGSACLSASPEPSDASWLTLHLTVDLRKPVRENANDHDVIGLDGGRSSVEAHLRLDDPHLTVISRKDLAVDIRSGSDRRRGALRSTGPIDFTIRGTSTTPLVSQTSTDRERQDDRVSAAIATKVVMVARERGWLPSAKDAHPS